VQRCILILPHNDDFITPPPSYIYTPSSSKIHNQTPSNVRRRRGRTQKSTRRITYEGSDGSSKEYPWDLKGCGEFEELSIAEW
jgi:hypothetical protein